MLYVPALAGLWQLPFHSFKAQSSSPSWYIHPWILPPLDPSTPECHHPCINAQPRRTIDEKWPSFLHLSCCILSLSQNSKVITPKSKVPTRITARPTQTPAKPPGKWHNKAHGITESGLRTVGMALDWRSEASSIWPIRLLTRIPVSNHAVPIFLYSWDSGFWLCG